MSAVQVDTALVEGENLPVWPDTGLEDMELGIGTLGEFTRRRRVESLGILVPE